MDLTQRNFAVRCFLLGAMGRDERNLPTYGDLHQVFGGGYQNQGRFLETIYEDCSAHDEPDLTVVVVQLQYPLSEPVRAEAVRGNR
jgi:hypothetical protein